MWGREDQSLHIHSAGPWVGLARLRLPGLQGPQCVPTAPSFHSSPHTPPTSVGATCNPLFIHTGVQWRGKRWLLYILQVTEIIQKSIINS